MSRQRVLLLMRHAKSSWADDLTSDEERPLNKRGKEAAKFMGKFLRDQDLAPDFIVASSAVRAQETARRVNKAGGFDVEIATASAMYLSGPAEYLRTIGHIDASVERLLVIGHNPDSEELVRLITGQLEAMPTGAIACIEVSAPDWSEFAENPRGGLRAVFRPKEVHGADSDA